MTLPRDPKKAAELTNASFKNSISCNKHRFVLCEQTSPLCTPIAASLWWWRTENKKQVGPFLVAVFFLFFSFFVASIFLCLIFSAYVCHVTTAGSLGDQLKCDNQSINQINQVPAIRVDSVQQCFLFSRHSQDDKRKSQEVF